MIPKQITFINESPDIVVQAVKEFCEPVVSTLGPGGCTVIVTDPENALPHVTKDGVTVAESIFFADPRKQAIASLIKEAARKTANSVGDGTTTSVVLTQAMILGGLERLSKVKNKKEFFEGFDLAFEKAIDYLSEGNLSIARDSKLLEAVVKISTNGDEKICKHIMSALKAAGPDGLVNVEIHDEASTQIDIKGGSSLESNTFIPGKRWEAKGNISLILISGALKEVHDLKRLLSSAEFPKYPNAAVIIAKEFSENVITTVAVNNQRHLLNVALVESEGFARGSRMDLLEDLSAIFLEPIYCTDGSTGHPLSDYSSSFSGELTKAVITPTETILFRASEYLAGEAKIRYEKLKKEYQEAVNTADGSVVDAGEVRHLQRRIAKYNTVATIKVGASTKAEAVEIKDRIDDALCAISAAVNGGITQGGGMALFKAGIAIENAFDKEFSDDKRLGYLFMASCCKQPFGALALNAGLDPSSIPIAELLTNDKVYDFRDFEVVDYLEGGIIDPAPVPIAALTNSSSVAKTILKSNSIISEWQDITGA